MKKTYIYTLSALLIFASFVFNNVGFGQLNSLGSSETILTTDSNDVIDTNLGQGTIGNPLREGAHHVVKSDDGAYEVGGIVDSDNEITQHSTALERTLGIIKNIINWALGILALVALVYIIVHGFIMLTATGDESKFKKGLKGIKNAAIAIGGIGLSWFIISLIFWVLKMIAG